MGLSTIKQNMAGFSFSPSDALHAAIAVIPSVILISTGNIAFGLAFAVGTLPTNQLGIAPKRKQRILFSILGCIFGLGIYIGSFIGLLDYFIAIGLVIFVISFLSAIIAARRPLGVILLSLVLPALAVGLGFDTQTGLMVFIAFILGSLWSGFVTIFWPETDKANNKDGTKAFVAENPIIYGILLGLSAFTAIIFGHFYSPAFVGWTATATLLIMRPYAGMVKSRSFWRALATVMGGIFAVVAIILQMPNIVTAMLVLAIMVLIIGTSSSNWWLMPFGTAFFVLSLSLIGETEAEIIKTTGWLRIIDNVVGALIALLFGLVIPALLKRVQSKIATESK